MIIRREAEKEIKKYLRSDQPNSDVLLLSGARQVGKSTLVKEVLKDQQSIFINLYERPTLAKQIDLIDTFDEMEKLLRRETNFTPSQGTILAIDEAQESKCLGRWIRFFKEKWQHQKVIVLGSILSNLFEKGTSYPVGRVEEIVLRPFSFKEYLIAIDREGLRETLEKASLEDPLSESEQTSFIKPYLEYLRAGGMPEVVLNKNMQTERAVDKLISQYAIDVERYMGEPYKAMFISAMDRIADITCHPIKNSQIISTDSTSYRKLPHLLEIMEKWHLIHKVSAQTKHPESAGGLASKRFLFDLGFTSFFINRSLPVEWKDRSDAGNLIFPKLQENFVCNEIITSFASLSLNYYKETRNSQEIDFIVPIKKQLIPIEVKSQSTISRNAMLPMCMFLEQKNFENGVLVYNGEMRTVTLKGKKIHAIPAFFISELISRCL